MGIPVREATIEDYDDLCRLFDQVDAMHRESLPDIFQEPDRPARSRDYFNRLIRVPSIALFVAEVSGRVAGFVHVMVENAPDFSLFVPRRYVTVDNLVVDREHRRQGIGRALMGKVHEWAQEKGATSIQLNVYEFNQAAIDFYCALGYETLSRRMRKPL